MTSGTQESTAKPIEERRSGTKKLIQTLTAERAEMLALYCRVAGLEPFNDEKDKQTVQVLLQKFCQVLVDYIAAGHFSLYERIVNGKERRKEVAALAERLYPTIAETTNAAMDFNDKYDCEDHCEITGKFGEDLSRLGEVLATRIEAEDQLLKVLY